VAEVAPRIADEEVLKLARDDRRVLLTEDTDFGELVFAEGLRSSGVILFRFPVTARASMAVAVLEVVRAVGEDLSTRFSVVQPGRVRVGTGNG
jgi:predicted nuclease of predicted toxin-antitoxin system